MQTDLDKLQREITMAHTLSLYLEEILQEQEDFDPDEISTLSALLCEKTASAKDYFNVYKTSSKK